ncbi:unnamed protein product [Symbiodinium necroappetens]|uniref:NYN domain-containing protein n=1 Tax=Symbiodinium necroappetens TaxID=1628268 RepID=A0A813BS82_9DINO|nr:unnamed protein product [Symbiodinium necroappetens]
MQHVASSCKAMETLIFAAPETIKKKTWQELLTDERVVFHPVTRAGAGKPGDSAIIDHLEGFIAGTASRIALLTSDRDFVPLVRRAGASGKQVLVVVPAARIHVGDLYRKAHADVHVVKADRPNVTRVKAVLLPGGKGSVNFCAPVARLHCPEEHQVVKNKLVELEYCTEDQHSGFMLNPMAKFWYENGRGSLVLFPTGLALKQVHQELVNNATRAWVPCERKLSVILPVGKRGKSSAAQIRKFGSNFACCIFRGGGPCIFEDSSTLAATVLRKLGFLDEQFNKDMREALLVFANGTENKYNLRDLGTLPCESDTVEDVQAKFRLAFLASNSSAMWQLPPADSYVRQLFLQDKRISHRRATTVEVFDAMRKYVRQKGWGEMSSYNALVWRIVYESNRTDPKRRDLVHFDA